MVTPASLFANWNSIMLIVCNTIEATFARASPKTIQNSLNHNDRLRSKKSNEKKNPRSLTVHYIYISQWMGIFDGKSLRFQFDFIAIFIAVFCPYKLLCNEKIESSNSIHCVHFDQMRFLWPNRIFFVHQFGQVHAINSLLLTVVIDHKGTKTRSINKCRRKSAPQQLRSPAIKTKAKENSFGLPTFYGENPSIVWNFFLDKSIILRVWQLALFNHKSTPSDWLAEVSFCFSFSVVPFFVSLSIVYWFKQASGVFDKSSDVCNAKNWWKCEKIWYLLLVTERLCNEWIKIREKLCLTKTWPWLFSTHTFRLFYFSPYWLLHCLKTKCESKKGKIETVRQTNRFEEIT